MLFEIILALLLECLIGTFTGLIPGIHINLISAILVSLAFSLLASINPIHLTVFIVAMAITHSFLDFIPSIFLGCPDTDTELSVLPGHKLLKKGQGYGAILLTAYGSLAAIFLLIIILFPSIFIIEKTYPIIKTLIPYILIIVSGFLILSEKKKYSALIVFILTGILGYFTLNSTATQPLLPLLTGLFGGSMLVLSIKNKTQIPQQEIIKPRTKLFKPLLGSLIASPLCSFLPGLGAGQAAIIGNTIARTNQKGFLVLLGATNTLVMGFSFISLYIISKTRTGAAIAIQQMIGTPSWKIFLLTIIIVTITGIISFFLTKNISKHISQRINNLNYTKISIFTLLILIIIVFAVSNLFGLLILIISTFTGIYCINSKVRRTNMMGCLLLPTIIFYLL